ncbi:Gar1/Naf1 RNA binding region-domain-containing protein [Fennellomyces sp. T-0311]|nr:Gar1/Naf1 RNA binding region-domain-containing protein [Fennellomyces sp. T-0311]
MSYLPDDLRIVAGYVEIDTNDVNDIEMKDTAIEESISSTDQQVSTEKAPAAEPTEETIAEVPSSESAAVDSIDTAIAQSQQPDEKAVDGYESSDLSSSSEDDDDNDDDGVQELESDADDDMGGKEESGPLRTKNELVEIIIDAPDFQITPSTELKPIGTIDEIIENVIVVHSYPDMANTVLDMGTLFAYPDRTLMGEVFETFGPVVRPYYSVRFNSTDEIDKEKAVLGAEISFVPSYERTQLVSVEELKKRKYTDASNVYDEEIRDEEAEFSDDEKEREFKQSIKRKKKASKAKAKAPPDQKVPRYDPCDFDHALAAYESGSGRRVQSYADLADDTPGLPKPNDVPWYMMGASAQQQQQPQVAPQQPYVPKPPIQPTQQPSTGAYQSPAELVSALLKSNSATIPNLSASGSSFTTEKKTSSVRSLFDSPPPSSKGA